VDIRPTFASSDPEGLMRGAGREVAAEATQAIGACRHGYCSSALRERQGGLTAPPTKEEPRSKGH